MKTFGLILGAGHIGKIHARRLQNLGVEISCADGRGDCLSALRNPNVPENGFALVSTPATFHFEYAKRALEAGWNVFVEKPLALSVADAEILIALAKEREKVLFVGHSERFNPAFERFRENFCRSHLAGIPLSLDFVRHNPFSVRGRDVSAAFDIGVHDFELFYELKRSAPEVSWDKVKVDFDFSRESAVSERFICAKFKKRDGTIFSLRENLCAPPEPGEADALEREHSEFLEILSSSKADRTEKLDSVWEGALFAVGMAERYSSPNSAK